MKTLWLCKTDAKKYTEDYLPTGDLHELAKDMANILADFHGKIHAHFEDEITRLIQLGAPENEGMELVSGQLVLIFDLLFDWRQEILEYSGEDEDAVEYMVCSLWITLRTHMRMEAFIKHGLNFDPTASFI